jgi:hypothetical protein
LAAHCRDEAGAGLVVQDAEAYQTLLDRIEAIEGIQRGLVDLTAGRTQPGPLTTALVSCGWCM